MQDTDNIEEIALILEISLLTLSVGASTRSKVARISEYQLWGQAYQPDRRGYDEDYGVARHLTPPRLAIYPGDSQYVRRHGH